jgi:hypothetical protein
VHFVSPVCTINVFSVFFLRVKKFQFLGCAKVSGIDCTAVCRQLVYPEISADRQDTGCLGLFWRHRNKINIEQNSTNAATCLPKFWASQVICTRLYLYLLLTPDLNSWGASPEALGHDALHARTRSPHAQRPAFARTPARPPLHAHARQHAKVTSGCCCWVQQFGVHWRLFTRTDRARTLRRTGKRNLDSTTTGSFSCARASSARASEMEVDASCEMRAFGDPAAIS